MGSCCGGGEVTDPSGIGIAAGEGTADACADGRAEDSSDEAGEGRRLPLGDDAVGINEVPDGDADECPGEAAGCCGKCSADACGGTCCGSWLVRSWYVFALVQAPPPGGLLESGCGSCAYGKRTACGVAACDGNAVGTCDDAVPGCSSCESPVPSPTPSVAHATRRASSCARR